MVTRTILAQPRVILAPSWLTFGAILEEPQVNLDALGANLDALGANLDALGGQLGTNLISLNLPGVTPATPRHSQSLPRYSQSLPKTLDINLTSIFAHPSDTLCKKQCFYSRRMRFVTEQSEDVSRKNTTFCKKYWNGVQKLRSKTLSQTFFRNVPTSISIS